MKNTSVNMLSGSITKGLLSLSLPIMIMNVMQSVFNIIDMTVLRYSSDERAVGAVGACGVLISLCTSLLIGLSAGANIVIARHIGAGNKDRVNKAVMTALLLSLVSGFLLLIVGTTFAQTFLAMTNCPDSLIRQATTYFRIYFYGTPFLMLYNFCAAILRAFGDTKKPMVFLLTGGVVKILFNLLFVLVFDMSAESVALATILSNVLASTLAFIAVLKNDQISLDIKSIRFDFKELREILFVGVPAGMQSALYSLANVVITTAVNSFGADATTGIAIANQFDGILYQITYAPSLATIPYVAQNAGAGNIRRVKQTVLRATLITTVFGGILGCLSAVFSAELSSIMSSSPAVIAFSQQKMIIISSTYFVCGINEVIGGALKGLRKPIHPMIATLVYMCLFRFVWVYGIFPHHPNLTFLYLVWPIGWTLSISTLLIPLFSTLAKLRKERIDTLQPQTTT